MHETATLHMTDKEYKALQAESALVKKQFRIVGGFALSALVFGAVFYHFTEGLKWIDAFYFSTITLATVGYGDIVPHTDLGKIFTTFYVLVGIGIIGTFANLFIKNTGIHRQLKRRTKL